MMYFIRADDDRSVLYCKVLLKIDEILKDMHVQCVFTNTIYTPVLIQMELIYRKKNKVFFFDLRIHR